MTKRLTDIAIKALPVPETGQRTYFEGHGFGVRVSQGGTRTFILVHGHKRRMVTLGRYPAVSLKDARKKALAIIGTSDGETPQDGAFLPLTEAVSAYLDHCEATNRARTVKDYRRHLARLPQGTLGDLTRRALSDLLADILAPIERFHVHATFRSFLNWCVGQGYLPTSPLPKHTGAMPKARERVLTDLELGTLLHTLPDTTFGNLIRALIYTGQRRGEVAALRSEWVGESTITWPKEITKNRTTHCLPLCGPMVDLVRDKTGLIFPSETGKLISGWSKFKKEIDDLTGVSGYCLHDLRRSFVSIHARIGTPIHVTEKLVNHISGTFGGIVSTYNRHTYQDEMRAALLNYYDFLAKLPKPGQ